MVRGDLRELHVLEGAPPPRAPADRRALSRGAARRLALHRQRGSARPRLPGRAQGPGGRGARTLGERPPRLDRRPRREHARSPPPPPHRGGAAPRHRARATSAGLPGAPPRAGEPQHVRRLHRGHPPRARLPAAPRGRDGLRPPPRRQQLLRHVLQQRPRSGRVHRGAALRARRADPPGRPPALRHAHRRHPRSPGRAQRVGALPPRLRAHGRRLHVPGVGRRHPALRGVPRRAPQGDGAHARRLRSGARRHDSAANHPGGVESERVDPGRLPRARGHGAPRRRGA